MPRPTGFKSEDRGKEGRQARRPRQEGNFSERRSAT